MNLTKDKQNIQRNIIQQNAVDKSKIHQFLCLQWGTGAGKTLASAKIIDNILNNNKTATGYLICKENTHKKNWSDDLNKHGYGYILKNTKTILYASIHKEVKKADYVIMDECHAITQKRIDALKPLLKKDVRIIFLSATIPREKKELMISLCRNIHFYTITLNKCFELGLLPEPSVIVHRVELSGKERAKYDEITKKMLYYEALSQDYNTLPFKARVGCRNKYLNLATVRKRFIAEVKTERVRKLVEEFRKNKTRFICFTGSVKQSISIGAKSAVHSKNKKEDNQYLIDCFNDNQCSELFAVKMLRESVNLFNIEKGIITQLDSGIGSFFQMLGRTLRHEYPEMHLFVINNTQDVKYFNNSMRSFNQKFITEYDECV